MVLEFKTDFTILRPQKLLKSTIKTYIFETFSGTTKSDILKVFMPQNVFWTQ